MSAASWLRERTNQARVAVADMKLPDLPSWWRRKDKAAQRNAAHAAAAPALIWSLIAAGVSAAIIEVGFMWVRVVRSVGDIEWTWRYSLSWGALTQPSVNDGAFAIAMHPLQLILLGAASTVIITLSLIWIPAQLALRGQGRWVRLTLIGAGLFCNSIALAGSFDGMNTNRLVDIRDEVVATRTVQSSVAAREAERDAIQTRLDELMGAATIASPSYQMQACRAGEAGWRARMVQSQRDDPARAQLIARSLPDAVTCDGLRQQRMAAIAAVSAARTEAASTVSTREVAVERATGADAVSHAIDTWSPLAMALALSLVAIFATFWATKLSQARALLDPTLGEKPREAEAEAEAPEVLAPTEDSTGVEPLVLADWRDTPDPEFEQINLTVDEAGRRQKRVAGHWRAADDAPAPRSRTDRRRAEEPPIAAPPPPPVDEPVAAAAAVEPEEIEEAEGGGDVDDILARYREPQEADQ